MWVQVERQLLSTWVTITPVPSLMTNLSNAGVEIRMENLELVRQRIVSTHHKVLLLSEQIVTQSRLRWGRDSLVHSLMTARSNVGVKTTLVNAAMVVDTAAISVHRQVQSFLSLLVELQHKFPQGNSMSALSSMTLLLFAGARTQKDN